MKYVVRNIVVYTDLNKVFEITKGKNKARWKIIKHPYFDTGFALVRDHAWLRSGVVLPADIDHIVAAGTSMESIIESAYWST